MGLFSAARSALDLRQPGGQPTVNLDLPGTTAGIHLVGAPAALVLLAVLALVIACIARFWFVQRRGDRANAGLVEARQYLQSLFMAMEEVVQVIDRDGVYRDAPQTRGQRHFGTIDTIVGKNVNDVLPAEMASHVMAITLRVIESRAPANTEFSVMTGDGPSWRGANVSPFGERAALWVVRNVTHQREARTALAEREAQYRLLFDSNPTPMWVYDFATLEILDVNPAAIAHYGYTRKEFTRMTLRELRAPEEIDALHASIRALSYDWMTADFARHRRKDGTFIDVEVRGSPIHLRGHKARLVAIVDVTDRLRAEAQVRAANQLMQRIFATAPQAIVVMDAEWRVTRWNAAAEALFGWTLDEVLGQPAPCVSIEERTRFLEAPVRDEHGTVRHSVEIEAARKDGTRVYVLLALASLAEGDQPTTGYVAIITDLTERMLLDEQQRHSQKMEAVGHLAGGIAHDFNNMLTVISSYAHLLLEDTHDPRTRADLEEIRLATQRATALTRQLLTFSRRDVVTLHPVSLTDITRGMESMLRRLLSADITIISKLNAELALVSADPGQIEQVIMNLVLNASDAMPNGGTLLIETDNTELDEAYARTHSDVLPGRYVLLVVTDTGSGMDPVTLRRAFEPFFTTKSLGRGTGLGLATVYAIVKQLRGHVWIYSEPGHGTSFKIYLPETHAAAGEADELVLPPARVPRGPETVLLVEDDDSVRRVVKRMLQQMSFTVIEAVDGANALEVLKSHRGPVHLVVTDLMMPVMNGRELANVLAVSNPGLHVLFTSGYTDDVAVRRGMMDSTTAFLQKPFTAEQLTRAIEAFYAQ